MRWPSVILVIVISMIALLSCVQSPRQDIASLQVQIEKLRGEVQGLRRAEPMPNRNDIGNVQGRYQIVSAGAGGTFLLDTSNGQVWQAVPNPTTHETWWKETAVEVNTERKPVSRR